MTFISDFLPLDISLESGYLSSTSISHTIYSLNAGWAWHATFKHTTGNTAPPWVCSPHCSEIPLYPSPITPRGPLFISKERNDRLKLPLLTIQIALCVSVVFFSCLETNSLLSGHSLGNSVLFQMLGPPFNTIHTPYGCSIPVTLTPVTLIGKIGPTINTHVPWYRRQSLHESKLQDNIKTPPWRNAQHEEKR